MVTVSIYLYIQIFFFLENKSKKQTMKEDDNYSRTSFLRVKGETKLKILHVVKKSSCVENFVKMFSTQRNKE